MQLKKDELIFYFPYLDGLRFFAFVLVFTHHAPLLWPVSVWVALNNFGWMGVDLFLCLSAFLFTKLLYVEYNLTGDINIKNFYLRRALRIWPLYFLFEGIILIITLIVDGFSINIILRTLGVMTFTDNILSAFFSYNLFYASGHLWTISYEEQFYAFIPLVLRKMFNFPQHKKIIVIISAVAVGTIIKALFILNSVSHPAIWVLPITHFESIIMGLVVGFGLFDKNIGSLPSWLVFIGGVAFLAGVTLLPSVNIIGWELILTYLFVGLGTGLILVSLVNSNEWFLKRMLQTKTLAYLGKISYGLYVYHYFGLDLSKKVFAWLFIKNQSIYPFFVFVFGLLITVILASLSYYWLEKPFLRLKERFASIQSRPL